MRWNRQKCDSPPKNFFVARREIVSHDTSSGSRSNSPPADKKMADDTPRTTYTDAVERLGYGNAASINLEDRVIGVQATPKPPPRPPTTPEMLTFYAKKAVHENDNEARMMLMAKPAPAAKDVENFEFPPADVKIEDEETGDGRMKPTDNFVLVAKEQENPTPIQPAGMRNAPAVSTESLAAITAGADKMFDTGQSILSAVVDAAPQAAAVGDGGGAKAAASVVPPYSPYQIAILVLLCVLLAVVLACSVMFLFASGGSSNRRSPHGSRYVQGGEI